MINFCNSAILFGALEFVQTINLQCLIMTELLGGLKGQCVKFSKFNHRFNGSNGLRI